MWDIDPQDWRRLGAGRISSFILKLARPGAVVLLHDGHGGGGQQTVDALDAILRGLLAQGYRFALLCE